MVICDHQCRVGDRQKEGKMPGPTKPFDPALVGKEVQKYKVILDRLFDNAGHQALRDTLYNCADETALRDAFKTQLDIDIAADVRIMLIDVENARWKSFDPQIDPKKDKFYVYILPPIPRRSTVAEYKTMQAWEGAWYHAMVDSYGM
jgi:hypothetical protein